MTAIVAVGMAGTTTVIDLFQSYPSLYPCCLKGMPDFVCYTRPHSVAMVTTIVVSVATNKDGVAKMWCCVVDQTATVIDLIQSWGMAGLSDF
jgi:hypothetical protein